MSEGSVAVIDNSESDLRADGIAEWRALIDRTGPPPPAPEPEPEPEPEPDVAAPGVAVDAVAEFRAHFRHLHERGL